jgi:hypothetical protein
MKRLLLLLLLTPFGPTLLAGEKANTVLIHPGETIYARFEQKGKKLKLLSAAKEADPSAQVIITFTKGAKNALNPLKVENKFPHDLDYRAEARSLQLKKRRPVETFPVVGGKITLEDFTSVVEEVALYEFSLEL